MLAGVVEVDETYVGGKPRKENKPQGSDKEVKKHKCGHGTEKTPIVLAVQCDGKSRAKSVKSVNSKNLREHVETHVDENTRIMTEGFKGYIGIGKGFKSHESVDYGAGEYARGDVNMNTAEN